MKVVPRLSLFFLASLLQRAHNFVLPLGPVSSSGSSLSAVQHYRLASRQLAASTAASTDQMGVSSSKPGGSEDGEILEPQGTHHPWWSLAPLNEASQWSSSPGEYFKDKSDAVGGAPVFKCHPGLASIAVLDHAAGEWFFNQPDSVLDRQLGARFGPLQCTETYVGKSLPALVTNLAEAHPDVRAYTLSILKERLGSVQSAWQHSSDNFYKNLWTNGLGEYPTVYDTFLQQSYSFMLEWVLATGEEGGQPLPDFKDFVNVNPVDISVLLKLVVDTPVANAAAKAAQAIAAGLSGTQEASVEVLLESIRSSRMYPKFVEMLEAQNVDIQDLENSFMFNTGFQSSSAIAKQMEYAVGTLSIYPDFLADLRKELDGKDLTMKNVDDSNEFPLLDSFHWEILRVFPAPPFFFKKAKMDLLVPTSSGKKYKVKKGDMLCAHHPLIHIDEAAFGPDATEFKPRRFIDNAALKKKVFAYAFPDPEKTAPKEGMPWGCAAHTAGMLDGALKLFYGRWVQEAEWEMKETPILDPVKYLGIVGPKGLEFSKVTPRK